MNRIITLHQMAVLLIARSGEDLDLVETKRKLEFLQIRQDKGKYGFQICNQEHYCDYPIWYSRQRDKVGQYTALFTVDPSLPGASKFIDWFNNVTKEVP